MSIRDAAGQTIDTWSVLSGELATTSILLAPGSYHIVVEADSSSLDTPLPYDLRLSSVDAPLGIEPVDPTEDPYCGYSFIGLFQCVLILGDVNGDGLVDFSDFLILSGNFGKEDVAPDSGDLDGDRAVGFGDFLILSQNFGQQNPAFEETGPG